MEPWLISAVPQPLPCRSRARASYAPYVPEAQGQHYALAAGAPCTTATRTHTVAPQVDGALTYGEYDLGHFSALVERACADRPGGLEGATLLDCGSGCGRLVVAASALWPEMERAIGIEKVEPLHAIGIAAVAQLPAGQQARLRLLCGDAHDLTDAMRQADVVFAYSSAFASQGDLLTDFSYTCGTRLRT